MSERNDRGPEGGRKDRRNLLSFGLAAIAGVITTVASRGNVAEAGHDLGNVFHLREVNFGGDTATVLHAAVPIGAPSPTTPGSTLMVTNGDGTPGKGFALFAVANTGAAGAIRGQGSDVPGVQGSSAQGSGVEGFSDAGAGVRGTSSTGPGVEAHSASPNTPALIATWTGDPNSATPHSGVFGSSSGKAPGVHGTSRTLGVLGRAALQDSTAALTDGIGVLGQSGSGPGVEGRSTTGPGLRGVSPELGVFGGSPKVGVLGQAKLPPPSPDLSDGTGVLGQSKGGAGVRGQSSSGPGLDGFSDSAPGVRGASGSGPGVLGVANATNPGVVGSSTTPLAGVNGHTTSGGPAVHGIAQGPGRGVLGTALQAGGTGVVAENPAGGLALDVLGKARFATAGLAVIPANATSVSVTAPVDPATSLALVTPLADTQRRALFVTMSAGSFSINVDDKNHPAIPVAWLIIEHT